MVNEKDASRKNTKSPRRKRWFAKLALIAGGCLLGLLVAELGFRFLGIGLSTDSIYQPDHYCGVGLVPGFRGWQSKEGQTWIEINSHGFRDRERTLKKPTDTYRIAVIGDSFAEALQVDLDKTFWSVMERKLTEGQPAGGRQIEVLNFGVSGFGTAQEFEMLSHYAWDYKPDMIMLQFLAANDVADNSKQLTQATGRPFYTLEDDKLVLDNSFLQDKDRVRFQTSTWIKLKDWVIHKSRIAGIIYQFRHQKREQKKETGIEAGIAAGAFGEPLSVEWKQSWALTDRLLVEMAKQAESREAKFVVLMANLGMEVEPDDAVFADVKKQLELTDFLQPERRMEALGTKNGFTVIRLAKPMREYANRHQVYLHGFPNTQMGTGHWNETGHRLVGELAADQLLENGLGTTQK